MIEDVKEIDIPMPTRRQTIKDTTLQDKLYMKGIEVLAKRESLYQQNKSSMSLSYWDNVVRQ